MENENQTPEQVGAIQKRTSPLHTITPVSKYLAMTIFIVLPFLGGWIGYTYAPEKVVEVEKAIYIEREISETESRLPFNQETADELYIERIKKEKGVGWDLFEPHVPHIGVPVSSENLVYYNFNREYSFGDYDSDLLSEEALFPTKDGFVYIYKNIITEIKLDEFNPKTAAEDFGRVGKYLVNKNHAIYLGDSFGASIVDDIDPMLLKLEIGPFATAGEKVLNGGFVFEQYEAEDVSFIKMDLGESKDVAIMLAPDDTAWVPTCRGYKQIEQDGLEDYTIC
jgi:hypothetical protein